MRRLAQPDYDPELDWDPQEPSHTQLLIIDEADRLKMKGLEQVRDFFDRSDMDVILIGMPGFDRQLAALQPDRLRPPLPTAGPWGNPGVLRYYWLQLGLPAEDLHPDGELVNAVARIPGGNFRLIERLMTQVARLRDVDDFRNITTVARQTLVVGAQ